MVNSPLKKMKIKNQIKFLPEAYLITRIPFHAVVYLETEDVIRKRLGIQKEKSEKVISNKYSISTKGGLRLKT